MSVKLSHVRFSGVPIPKRPKLAPDNELETPIQARIRLTVGQLPDVRIWRNNVGEAKFKGSPIPVKYGLMVGSSDLIGVGPGGRFLALEVKKHDGKPSKAQQQFLNVVRSMGGFGCVVRSESEALAAIERMRRGENE